MSPSLPGQRCLSTPEPELGLGLVESIAGGRISVSFPAAGERRLYALGTTVLTRVVFRDGQRLATRDGPAFTVAAAEETAGLLTYLATDGQRFPEALIADAALAASPLDRLLSGQTDPSEVFDLRRRALDHQARLRASPVRGFLGGRLELIPHQFYLTQEIVGRSLTRVLLADEVGLGKTIEACLVLQRLLTVGRVRRALILVPESLVHQWFVELLRRFNFWFGIFDEARCLEAEAAEPGENPFSSDQLVLCSTAFPARDERRFAQLVAAGWDLVIVDEAHHLAWSRDPAAISPAYHLVEQLAARTPGLLLLTATPTQLGPEGHFARLRLLDPDRYRDFSRFVQETEGYGTVATIAEKIVESRPLTATDQRILKKIFHRDPARLATHLTALTAAAPGARDTLLKTLLDQYGPGRVIFRNTRATMSGFPRRAYHPVALPIPPDHHTPAATLLTRIAREIEAEETGRADELRYNFKDDPRLLWLVEFLLADRERKVLLICRNARKVAALDAAIQTRAALKTGLFHEGLPLVQRDRQAAWFAEPAGAQLLLCSEIGSEGRNFQFAHHLVLFDLPLNPGLVEQRIGRLDRIGQSETIRLHVPYLADSAGELLAAWYDAGLAAFAGPLHGGAEFEAQFRERVLTLVARHAIGRKLPTAAEIADLLAATTAFRVALQDKLHRGRDRLLELASFDPVAAEKLLAQVRAAEADPTWRRFLVELLDHYGVRVKEHEDGDVFLNANHAYVEGFPAIPRDGMLATFDRRRAIAREDIRFVTPDHALVRDTLDLLLNSPAGSTGFGVVESGLPGLLLEAVFVLETVADTQWHVDQFLPPQPVRVVVNLHSTDVSAEWTTADTAELVEDAPLARFLERPGFNADLIRALATTATETAETRAAPLRTAAAETVRRELAAEIERLRDLQKVNDHVRPAEIALAEARLDSITTAIAAARLRLDAVRLIVTGWDE